MRDALLRQIEAALPADLPPHLGVAVSGGGDSIALLALLADLFRARGIALSAVTVDHRLRPEAAAEAEAVAQLARRLQISHETLVWEGWDGSGNLQDAARRARYGLMVAWARARGIGAIVLGHTLDDQAETVLMRLARGAGVDGLSGMTPDRQADGMRWLRPMLGLRREALRAFLKNEGVDWHDDPSNDDPRYDRVRIRQALHLLEPLGISPESLGQVAQHMQAARGALDRQTADAARAHAQVLGGGVAIACGALEALPAEIARRLIVCVLRWISGASYAPRQKSVDAAMDALRAQKSATLEGCRLLTVGDRLWIFREHGAVRDLSCPTDALWDGRWRLKGPGETAGLHVAALGAEGLARCPGWRDTGLPRDLLLAGPAVWRGSELVAAPLAGRSAGWVAVLDRGDASFFHTPFSH